MAKPKTEIRWLEGTQSHNYPAALSYLSLIYRPGRAKRIVSKLEAAGISEFKSKDIFRASALSLLGISNSHVESDREKIKARERLSPILLVRDAMHGRVVIADGYHRLCAIYTFDEDAVIRCKITDS
jgi:predicted nucleic acid-binding protein